MPQEFTGYVDGHVFEADKITLAKAQEGNVGWWQREDGTWIEVSWHQGFGWIDLFEVRRREPRIAP